VLDDSQLADVFGIEIAAESTKLVAETPRQLAPAKTAKKKSDGAGRASPRKARASPTLPEAAKTPATKSPKARPKVDAMHKASTPKMPPQRGTKASIEPTAAPRKKVAGKAVPTGARAIAKPASTRAKKFTAAKPANARQHKS
jgi:hypothetical protein